MDTATEGSFFEGGHNIDRHLSTLSFSDVEDIRNTDPSVLNSIVERAYEAENPELAIFVTGVMAARALEPLMAFGRLNRNEFETAVSKLLPNWNGKYMSESRVSAQPPDLTQPLGPEMRAWHKKQVDASENNRRAAAREQGDGGRAR